MSFTPAEGRDSAESIETSHPGCVVLVLEGDSAPSHACHKPTQGEIPLASAHMCTKQALARELLVSALMLIKGEGRYEMQMSADI